MRLDHLLSKEHLAPSGVQAPDLSERLSRLAHGWNIDIGAEPNGSNSVHPLADRKGSILEALHMHAVGS